MNQTRANLWKFRFLIFILLPIYLFELTLFYYKFSIGQLLTFLILFLTFRVEFLYALVKLRYVVLTNLFFVMFFVLYNNIEFNYYLIIHIKSVIILLNGTVLYYVFRRLNVDYTTIVKFLTIFFVTNLFFLVFSRVEGLIYFRSLLISERDAHLEANFGNTFSFRDSYISGLGYSGFALGAVPLLVLILNYLYLGLVTTKERVKLLFLFTLIFVLSIFAGRSVLLFLPIFFLQRYVYPKIIVNFLFYGAFLSLILFFFLKFVLFQLDIPESFVFFFMQESDSRTGLDSLDDLLFSHTNLQFGINLFGHGKYLLSDSSFAESDIGFLRQLGYGGISLLALNLFNVYKAFSLFAKGRELFYVILIVTILNFKQEVLNNSMVIGGLFVYLYFEEYRKKSIYELQ